MTNERIKKIILDIADEYSFKNVVFWAQEQMGLILMKAI